MLFARASRAAVKHEFALRLATKQPCVAGFAGQVGNWKWPCHRPAKLRELPNGGLRDELLFSVGVGAHGGETFNTQFNT